MDTNKPADGGFRVHAQPLPPPNIPAAAKGGLGYEDIGRNPTASVRVLIGPWDGYEDGDTVFLMQGSRVMHSVRASAADKYGTVEMWVPNSAFALMEDGRYAFSARVVNALGLPVDSPSVTVLIKISVPGGLDTDPATPYINEALALPVVVPLPVTPTTEQVSVTAAAWVNMFEGDTIVFRWGVTGNDMTHVVTAEQARERSPITVVFDRAKIDRGGTGAGINVNYYITDIVGDWSLWSRPAKDGAPRAPRVRPTVGDLGETIDLDELGSADVFAEVRRLDEGDRVVVHMVGSTASGQPVAPWDSDPFIARYDDDPLDQPIPNRLFKDMAQGRCSIWYTLTRGGVSSDSLRRHLAVTAKVAVLTPPTVEEAVDGSIDPEALGESAHVLVAAHALIGFGAEVTMTMTGTTAGGDTVSHSEKQDIGRNPIFPLRFEVPASKLRALKGMSATFSYTVDTFETVNGRAVRRRLGTYALFPSPSRDYDIKGASDDLPLPVLPQAEGDRIDPDRIGDAVLVQVDTSALTSGDIVVLDWRGTGGPQTYTDELLVRGAQVEFRVPKAQLMPHVGADLLISYSVELKAGGTKRAGTLVLHVRRGIGALPKPGVDESGGTDTLLPAAITKGMTVRLPAALPLLPTDRIQVVLTRPGFIHTTPAEPYRDGMTFAIPASVAGRFIGTQLTVTYQVIREGALYESETLTLHVLPVKDDDSTLMPAPYIPEAVGDELILSGAWKDATVHVDPWPFIAAGQPYTIRVTSGAIEVTRITGTVSATDITQGVGGTLLRAELEKLGDNAPLSVVCEVDFQTGGKAIRFPARAYTLIRSVAGKPMPWYFENFDQLVLLKQGYRSDNIERVGNFTLVANFAMVDSKGQRPPLEGICMQLREGSRLNFDKAAKTVQLVVYNNATLSLVNEEGTVFHKGPGVDRWFTYTASIQPIGGLVVNSFDTEIDKVRWEPFHPDVPPTNSLDEDFSEVPVGNYGLQLTSNGWSFSHVSGEVAVVELDNMGRKALMLSGTYVSYPERRAAIFTPRVMCRPRSVSLDMWGDEPDGTTTVTVAYAKEDFDSPVRFESRTISLTRRPQTITLPGGRQGEHLVSLHFKHDGGYSATFFENILVAADDGQWPAPVIKPSRSGKIVLPSFEGDLAVIVAPWQGIGVNQRYRISVKSGGATVSEVEGGVKSNEVTAGLSVVLPRGDLEKLGDGASLQAICEVDLGDGYVRFPTRTYTLVRFLSVGPMLACSEDFDRLRGQEKELPLRVGRFTLKASPKEWIVFQTKGMDSAYLTGAGYTPLEFRFDQAVKSVRFFHPIGGAMNLLELLDDNNEVVYSQYLRGYDWFNYVEAIRPIRTIRIQGFMPGYIYRQAINNLSWVYFHPDVTSAVSLNETFEDVGLGNYGNSLQTEAWCISRGSGDLDIVVPNGQAHQALSIRATGPWARAQYLDTLIPRLTVSPKKISLRLWSDTGGTTRVIAGYAETVFSQVRYESISVQRNSSSQQVSVGGARAGEYLVSLQLQHDGDPQTMYYDDIQVEV